MLAAKFAHIDVLRTVNRVRMWPLQLRPIFFQQADREINAVLLDCRQAVPPVFKLIGELNFIRHCLILHLWNTCLCRTQIFAGILGGVPLSETTVGVLFQANGSDPQILLVAVLGIALIGGMFQWQRARSRQR